MVTLATKALRHELSAYFLEPLLRSKLGGLRSMTDLSEPGVDPADHLLRLMAQLLRNGVETHRSAVVKGLKPRRAVGLSEHPGFGLHESHLTACERGHTVLPSAASNDKGKPGKSRGRKATGPRLLRDADQDAVKDPKTAELPKWAARLFL